MRMIQRGLWSSLTIVVAVLVASGCGSQPKAAGGGDAGDASDPAATQAERYAKEVAAAMAGGAATAGANEAAPEVKWIQPGSPVPAGGLEAGKAPAPRVDENAQVLATPAPIEVVPEPATAQALGGTPKEELYAMLRERLAAGGDVPLRAALDAATIGVLDPAGGFDRAILEPLPYEQRDVVERYLQTMAMMYAEVAKGESQLDRQAIDSKLDELFGHQPIRIRSVQLCRRVSGYGVYEPFENATFLAGREQKAIVYVELDHFQPQESETGYEVRLRQEVALYNEADGLAVWRNDAVEIQDESKNRRRDFFVVQLVALPARMTVGKFRLKVSITDLHGGSIDETSIPIEFVADQSLVKNER